MKIRHFLLFLTSLFLISCSNKNGQVAEHKKVESIILNETDIKLNVGGTFELLAYIAPEDAYNKNVLWSSLDYSVATVENGLVSALKDGTTYIIAETVDQHKIASCKVTVFENVDYWPSTKINNFLNEKGIVGVTIPSIKISKEEQLLQAETFQSGNLSAFEIIIQNNCTTQYIDCLINENYSIKNNYYVDNSEKVAISCFYQTNTIIRIFDYSEIKNQSENECISYKLHKSIGNEQSKQLNFSSDGFNFSFNLGSGSVNPKSQKGDNGYVAIYTGNTFEITGRPILKILLSFTSSNVGNLKANTGVVTCNADKTELEWTGNSDSIIFTAESQSRLTNITIYYLNNDHDEPSPEGIVTISKVLEIASKIKYTPNSDGWYLSTTNVTIQAEAIDAIDSTSTSGGLSPNARGKVLVVDNDDYIICSSSVSTNNPISFYQRVKDYLKAGTTQYLISGKIAFLNGVVEINVSTYKYDSSIVIQKNFETYVSNTFTKSAEFVDDVLNNAKVNPKGYGVNKIIKMEGLTCINKYNDAGSYLFTDQTGKIVPVFSCLDKDKAVMSKGKCFDIIGLESLYLNRPSLRILNIKASTYTPVMFNFKNDSVSVSDLSSFYNIKRGSGDIYNRSELIVYKADVYVSRYAEDSYTFNTNYYFNNTNKVYSTGNSKSDAASRFSLGIFNSDLTYKQTLLSYLLELCDNDEQCANMKIQLYFTLAFADTVDGKNMWRVNIFEELVDSLEYYEASSAQMKFDLNEENVECSYTTGEFQEWTCFDLKVNNFSTDTGIVKRDVDSLKIIDSTGLSISYNKPILGFVLYHSTYSYLSGLDGTKIKAVRQFSNYTELILSSPNSYVLFDHISISGEAYLTVTKIEVKFSTLI